MSRLCIIGAKDAGNLSVDLLFSDQTTRPVVTLIRNIINILTLAISAASKLRTVI